MKNMTWPIMENQNKKGQNQNNDTQNHSKYPKDRTRKQKEAVLIKKAVGCCTPKGKKDG